jgi:hypothetical protein
VITRRYDLRVSCRSLKVVFILPGLLCVLVAAAGCGTSGPKPQDTAGLQSTDRERLVPMTGLGNQAFEVEFSTVSPNVPVAASNWVVIRSGRILLTVYERAISGSVEKYLQAATQAAWRVFSHSS